MTGECLDAEAVESKFGVRPGQIVEFLALTGAPVQKDHKIHINYRSIKTRFCSNGIIWFDFQIICGDQRGSTDYIHIAQQFHSVFISGIQKMNDGQNDKARRFLGHALEKSRCRSA